MNTADLIIILLAIATAARGAESGFLRQAGYLAGLIGGLFLGSMLAPYLTGFAQNEIGRFVVTLVCVFGVGALIASVGELIGWQLRKLAHNLKAGVADNIAGGILGAASVAVAAWLLAGAIQNLPLAGVGSALSNSSIVRATASLLPPAPGVVARLENIISPNGFPRVFTGLEPSLEPVDPPSSALVADIQAKAATSTVKIQGPGCGGLVSGSGFVAADGLVMTNAHVIAGVREVTVIDRNGRHRATPILFNSSLDIAVLRTTGLAGPVLPLAASDPSRGQQGAVLGYPGGGPLVVSAATLISQSEAAGRDIYGRRPVVRTIQSLSAKVEQGDSGGPFVLADGSVGGVVFAKSVSNSGVGYSITASDARAQLATATRASGPVATGACAE